MHLPFLDDFILPLQVASPARVDAKKHHKAVFLLCSDSVVRKLLRPDFQQARLERPPRAISSTGRPR